MINLLPQGYKKSLQRMYYFRLGTTVLLLLFSVSLVAGILLVPSYIISNIKEKSLSENLKVLERGESFDTSKTMNKAIADINQKVTMFPTEELNPLPSADVVTPVLARKPNGVSVTAIGFGSDGAAGTAVIVRGTATNRETLEKFITNLRTYNRFSKVDFPISNFVKSRDIDFAITCTFI